MVKIGLTGGICSGKTFILEVFSELGCYAQRADEIAREIIFAPDSKLMPQIKEAFGSDIYDEEKGFNKEQFTKILFEDAEKRHFINNIVHPLVIAERNRIFKDLEKSGLYKFVVYESALLVESGTYKDFDKIIVVYTSTEEQIRRLMIRDSIAIDEAEKKIRSQFPLSEKLKVAHYTIDTSGSFDSARVKALETYHLMQKDMNA